ncbi:MAG: hypothetical protein ICV87_01665, partial [Gemmatimonadetes bacterium]|nr:hypothetical protein [Gemmatimonadota bacterium]
MLPPSKRLNYFDHQFLRRDDFADEQAYHLGMRRAHNRMLHTPGVAQGLVVAADGTGITVSEGVAIDAEGRELVLADDVERDLASTPGDTLWVTMVYREERVDRTNETGAEGDRRTAERGEVAVTAAEPAGDGLTLVLARVTRGEGGALRVDDGQGNARRRAASAVGGELRADTLEVRGPARAEALTLVQELAAASFSVGTGQVAGTLRAQALQADDGSSLGAATARSLKVQGEVTAGGLVVDGSSKTSGAMQIGGDAGVDGTLRVQNEGRFGTRVGVGVGAPEAPLHLAGGNINMVTGEGDLKIGSASVRMKLGVGIGVATGDGRIQVQGGANRLMVGTAGIDILHVHGGGVGVGGPATSAGALTVAGGVHFGVGGAPPASADRRLLSTADGTLRWQVPVTAPTRAL